VLEKVGLTFVAPQINEIHNTAPSSPAVRAIGVSATDSAA
jgi:hypothetical protein